MSDKCDCLQRFAKALDTALVKNGYLSKSGLRNALKDVIAAAAPPAAASEPEAQTADVIGLEMETIWRAFGGWFEDREHGPVAVMAKGPALHTLRRLLPAAAASEPEVQRMCPIHTYIAWDDCQSCNPIARDPSANKAAEKLTPALSPEPAGEPKFPVLDAIVTKQEWIDALVTKYSPTAGDIDVAIQNMGLRLEWLESRLRGPPAPPTKAGSERGLSAIALHWLQGDAHMAVGSAERCATEVRAYIAAQAARIKELEKSVDARLRASALCPDDLMALNTAALNVEWAYRVRDALTTLQAENEGLRREVAELSLERAAEQLSERNGQWIDSSGCCKLCDGELPDGHIDECDLLKENSNG